MKVKWIVLGVVVLLVIAAATGVGAYAAGKKVGQTEALDARAQFFQDRGGANGGNLGAFGGGNGGNGATGGNRQFNRDNFTGGQVKSVNGNTIELSTATSVIKVNVSDKTQIQKMDQGTLSDVQTGQRVTVIGTKNADGSYDAQSIQIGGRFGGDNGQPGRNSNQTTGQTQ